MTEIISIRARIPSIRTESRNEDRGEKKIVWMVGRRERERRDWEGREAEEGARLGRKAGKRLQAEGTSSQRRDIRRVREWCSSCHKQRPQRQGPILISRFIAQWLER